MRTIGILTHVFSGWSGGTDFMRKLIFALKSVADEQNLRLIIIAEPLYAYKSMRGPKRLWKKFLEKKLGRDLKPYPVFLDCGLPYVVAEKNQIKAVVQKEGIQCLIPNLAQTLAGEIPNTIGYLYDCQHKYLPHFFSPKQIEARDEFFVKMLAAHDKIIVNAQSAREDFIKFYGASEQKVYALPFAPILEPEYLQDTLADISEFSLPKRYFLISNQFWKHKDHTAAFTAFSHFVSAPQYSDFQLVCTGATDDLRDPAYIESLHQLIHSLGMEAKIRLLGLIDKKKQIQIMKGAVAVVQPTLFEGGPGGGAVFEAITLGVPSIVSDIPTNREINEGEVSFFSAGDPEDLARKMAAQAERARTIPAKEALLAKSQMHMQKLGNFICTVCFDD